MKPTKLDILQHMLEHSSTKWTDTAVEAALWAAEQTELSNQLYIQQLETTIKSISEIMEATR
jgi:hypothetical protein